MVMRETGARQRGGEAVGVLDLEEVTEREPVELAVRELVAPAVSEPDSDGVAGGVAVLE
jgi:hypothetical protein